MQPFLSAARLACRTLCAAALVAGLASFGGPFSGAARAQLPTPAAAAKAPPAVDKSADKPAPVSIPLAEVPRRAEDTSTLLKEIRDEAASDPTLHLVDQELRAVSREIDARLAENRKAVTRTSSIETLRRIEARWYPLRRSLAGLSRDLTRRLNQVDRQLALVDELDRTWEKTLEDAKTSGAPPEVLRRIESLRSEITQTREALAAQRARMLTLQNRVATQDGRVADALTAVRRAREDVEANLFARDSPPLWSADLRSLPASAIAAETQASIATQWSAVQAYGERQSGRFLVHALVFIAFAALIYWSRRRVHLWLKDEPHLPDTAPIFDVPIASALLLSILVGFFLYPDAPILLLAALGALAVLPAAVILRRHIEPGLYPVLYALVVFYFLDQVRFVVAPVQLLPRLLSLAETFAAALFAAWLAFRARRHAHGAGRTANIERRASFVALAIALTAFVANALGYVALASLLGNTLFGCAYVALTLYAIVRILDGLFLLALHVPPLALLGAVRRHRVLLRHRFRRGMRWLAVALWILFALDRLALRQRLFRTVHDLLTMQLDLGALSFSLADVFAFVLIVWTAFLVSRFVRFLLEEDIYPRFRLTHGLPYAISTLLNYVILVVGFFAGVAALGFDMTKFTILAGAFSIGVGFGLQNVFNNFVSGLILLFERPVKVGDVIQIENTPGVVQHIGIRASTIRTSEGSEIIVPNSKLISDRVINFTFSGNERSIQLPISVAIGTDLKRVIQVLEESARKHPLVAREPPPKTVVVRMGPDWLGLELYAWTNRPEQWLEIRSDLAVAAASALAEEKIAVR